MYSIKFKMKKKIYDPEDKIENVILIKKIKYKNKFKTSNEALDYIKNDLVPNTFETMELKFNQFDVKWKKNSTTRKVIYKIVDRSKKGEKPYYRIETLYEFIIKNNPEK